MADFISTLKILMISLGRDLHSQAFILEGRVRLGRLERIVVEMMDLEVCLNLLLRGHFLRLRRLLRFRGRCISRWYIIAAVVQPWTFLIGIILLGIRGTSDIERSWCSCFERGYRF